jgi:hypothetical protein
MSKIYDFPSRMHVSFKPINAAAISSFSAFVVEAVYEKRTRWRIVPGARLQRVFSWKGVLEQ